MNPLIWLGAYSPGGLTLPDAQPTPSQMYGPRGVFMTDDLLIVADSGNHRVLIWHGLPREDRAAADVVLGQADFYSEGPQAAGRGAERGLYLPTGVGVFEGKLFVGDAWNHRVLVWHELPQRSDVAPDYVLGQSNLSEVDKNRGGDISSLGMYWPYGINYINGWFYVTDTGNRRLLGWRGLPEAEQPPDLILGQEMPYEGLENRGSGAAANSFRWPHDIAGTEAVLYVADAGNHRILGWSPPPTEDCEANLLIGQPNFTQAEEWPYGPQGAQRLRFPYAITLENNTLAVADTANNRILLWHQLPLTGAFQAADAVIGQLDFDANGENHWKVVGRDSLCWPYGIYLHKGLLAIADSGNNRVMIWQI